MQEIIAGTILGGGALLAIGTIYKIGQAALDEDFGTTEFPALFRDDLITSHIESRGHYCTACGCRTWRRDFQVDHIVALVNGGRTSRANARVICRWCNARKGGRNDTMDYFWGRSA
jgi:hypothetical protein